MVSASAECALPAFSCFILFSLSATHSGLLPLGSGCVDPHPKIVNSIALHGVVPLSRMSGVSPVFHLKITGRACVEEARSGRELCRN